MLRHSFPIPQLLVLPCYLHAWHRQSNWQKNTSFQRSLCTFQSMRIIWLKKTMSAMQWSCIRRSLIAHCCSCDQPGTQSKGCSKPAIHPPMMPYAPDPLITHRAPSTTMIPTSSNERLSRHSRAYASTSSQAMPSRDPANKRHSCSHTRALNCSSWVLHHELMHLSQNNDFFFRCASRPPCLYGVPSS